MDTTIRRYYTMDNYMLRSFFYEMIKLGIDMPGRPGFGSPISWLLEQMCVHQDKLIDRICGDYTRDGQEWRINTAGLKLYWRVERDDRYARTSAMSKHVFRCHIGGDQVKDYVGFVVSANKLIKKYNYNRR
jgi:hypothetical protein